MPSKSTSINLDTYNELVGSIYDAAMDIALWPIAMKGIVDSLNARSGILRVQDMNSKDVLSLIPLNLDDSYMQKYQDHYIHCDPIMPVIEQHAVGKAIQTRIDMPDSFRESEFYNDYAVPQKMHHSAGCCLVKSDSRKAMFGFHRPDRFGYFKRHEMELFHLLIPHLQRAIHTNQLITRLTNQANAATGTLNTLSLGIILLGTSGKPVFINHHAETIITDNYGLTINRQGIQASTRSDTQALRKLIFEACQAPLKTGGAIAITNPLSPHPLSILVSPVNQELELNLNIDTSKAAAVLFIGAGRKQHDFSLDILCQFYGLTRAEARLAAALANGYSLEQIAKQFKVSKNTVRTQLKSCFQKTGVSQQTQLVKLILCDPITLRNSGTFKY